MPSRSERASFLLVAVLVLFVLFLLLALPAAWAGTGTVSATRAGADRVLVREGDVVDEDLYAGGNQVEIRGTVEGDLVVAAFERLVISGEVQGDVVGAARRAVVSGTIGGSVRLAGDTLRLGGDIGDDVFVAARSVIVEESAAVGRDVVAWSGDLELSGQVGRNVEGQVLGTMRLAGDVNGDVEISVSRLVVAAGARVAGDLGYRSGTEAEVAPGAAIEGGITRRRPLLPNVRVRALRQLTILLIALTSLMLGFLLLWLLPRSASGAVEAVRRRPLAALLAGLGVLATPLLLLVGTVAVLAVSAPDLAVAAVVAGGPVWLAGGGLLALGLLAAPVPVVTAAGWQLLRLRRSAFAGYLLGSVLWWVVLLVPVLRLLVASLVLVGGLGAWALGLVAARGSLRWTAPQESERRRSEAPPEEAGSLGDEPPDEPQDVEPPPGEKPLEESDDAPSPEEPPGEERPEEPDGQEPRE